MGSGSGESSKRLALSCQLSARLQLCRLLVRVAFKGVIIRYELLLRPRDFHE